MNDGDIFFGNSDEYIENFKPTNKKILITGRFSRQSSQIDSFSPTTLLQ